MPHIDTADLHTCNEYCARRACVERRLTSDLARLVEGDGTSATDAAALMEAFDITAKGAISAMDAALDECESERQAADDRHADTVTLLRDIWTHHNRRDCYNRSWINDGEDIQRRLRAMVETERPIQAAIASLHNLSRQLPPEDNGGDWRARE